MSTQHNNGWIALETRKPTKEDADDDGFLPIIYKNTRITSSANWDSPVIKLGNISHFLPLPPLPESEEQKRARLDEEAVKAGLYHWQSVGHSTVADAIRAALRYARQPEARP